MLTRMSINLKWTRSIIYKFKHLVQTYIRTEEKNGYPIKYKDKLAYKVRGRREDSL